MNNGQITFKSYSMEQMSLLPPSLEELIPEHHLVRVVNRVVEELEIEPLMAKYKGGGTSSYHPRMMLKVIVYAYTLEDAFIPFQSAFFAAMGAQARGLVLQLFGRNGSGPQPE